MTASSAFTAACDRRAALRLLTSAGCAMLLAPMGSCSSFPAGAEEKTAAARLRLNRLSPEVRSILETAVLAPSGHNTQPWLFAVDGNTIVLRPDYSRRLPAVDPRDRELFISLGCAVETLALAARSRGFDADTAISSDPAADEIRITLTALRSSDQPCNALVQAVPLRQCTRSEYDGRPVPASTLAGIERSAASGICSQRMFAPGNECSPLIELVRAGNTVQMNDDAFMSELKQWIRFSTAETEETRDGLSSRCMGRSPVPGWLGRLMFGLVVSADDQSETDTAAIRSSSGIVLFATPEDDRNNWIETGRCYQRWALAATSAGVTTAFINQPVEVPALRDELARHAGIGIPQLLIRYGHAPALPRSLRRPLEDVLIDA